MIPATIANNIPIIVLLIKFFKNKNVIKAPNNSDTGI